MDAAFNKLIALDLPERVCSRNLASEEALLDLPCAGAGYLLLWQNEPAVVIGRHQDAAAETNLPFLRAREIQLVRRLSGGGAVYHDLGALNFSLVTRLSARAAFARLLAGAQTALANLGIDAQISGRNDLLVSGAKISGASLYTRHDRTVAHGTMLVNADLETLAFCLRPSAAKLRGLPSVRSRVANLCEFADVSVQEIKQALLTAFDCQMAHAPHGLAIAEYEARYLDPAWNFGRARKFQHETSRRLETGELVLKYNLADGRISECDFCSDFMIPLPVEELAKRLYGRRVGQEGIDLSELLRELSRDGVIQRSKCDGGEYGGCSGHI